MSAPGCPYDNSCIESFFAGLKKECTRRKKYETIEDVKRAYFSLSTLKNRKKEHENFVLLLILSHTLTSRENIHHIFRFLEEPKILFSLLNN